jgi:hypothetical protein
MLAHRPTTILLVTLVEGALTQMIGPWIPSSSAFTGIGQYQVVEVG